MDIARPSAAKEKRRRRIIYTVLGVVVIAGITMGLSKLKPAAPSVEWGTIWPDTVKRGSMLRQVRGLGTLVPEEIRWIPALADGRVEKILVRPGTPVKAADTLVVLSNPQVEQATLDAQFQLRTAEADLKSLEVQLQSQYLDQKANMAKAQADFETARLAAKNSAELTKLGVVAPQANET